MKIIYLDRGIQCQCMVFRQVDGECFVVIYTRKEQLCQYLRRIGTRTYHSAGLCRFHAEAGLNWEQFAKEVARRAAGSGVVGIMNAVVEATRVLSRSSQKETGFKIAMNKPVWKMNCSSLFFCQQDKPYICDSEAIAKMKGGKIFPFSCEGKEELIYLVEQAEFGMKMDGLRFSFPQMILYTKQKFSNEDARELSKVERISRGIQQLSLWLRGLTDVKSGYFEG